MAISPVESDVVSRGLALAKKLIEVIKPEIDYLQVLYDSQGGVKVTLTQDELDSVPSFKGITKTQLDDGMYVMTATIQAALAATGGFTQLVQLAVRA